MKGWTSHLPVKVLLVILATLCGGAILWSGAGLYYLYENELYGEDIQSYYSSHSLVVQAYRESRFLIRQCYIQRDRYYPETVFDIWSSEPVVYSASDGTTITYYDGNSAWWEEDIDWDAWEEERLFEFIASGGVQDAVSNLYPERSSNFAFEVFSLLEPEYTLASNYQPEYVGAEGVYLGEEFGVRWQVRSPLQPGDEFYIGQQLFDLFYPARKALPWVLGLSGLALLLSVIFLMAAAGHRRDREEIVLSQLDRIPLELHLVGAIGLMALCVALPSSLLHSLYYQGIGVTGAIICLFCGCLLAFLVGLHLLYSLSARIKAGAFWRNTLLWRCWNLCRNALGRIWGLVKTLVWNIPILWRFMAVFLLYLTISVIVFYLFIDMANGFFFFLFCFVQLAALGGVCYIVLMLQTLKAAGERLAEGDLDYQVETDQLRWDFKEHGEALNRIGEGMAAAVEQRMRSERLKTELITNVSHDIKTPLTSILNYVDLLGQEELGEQAAHHLEVLDRQAKRLKKLTEDLVEMSKATTGNLAVQLEPTGVGEMLRQSLGEYAQRLEAERLEAVITAPAEELFIQADGRLFWRVMDNLLSNVCKYSLTGTRVYLDVTADGGRVGLAIKNISRERLNVEADELIERFVRGDVARSTEGSGLGLNIAKSLVELMGGTFSLTVDGDLFKAEMSFLRNTSPE